MVNSVEAAVTIDSPDKDVTVNADLVAYDKDGNVVSGITFSQNQVKVKVGISKSKRVLVKATIQGTPAEGYTVENISCDPQYIDITGTDSVLQEISEITLPVVNVNGRTANVETVYDIDDILPENVKPKDGVESEIKVTVSISTETTKELIIDSSKINIEGKPAEGLQASFVPENVHLTIKGSKNAIDSVNESEITGTVNVDNLTEGTHVVEVEFNLPDGVSIVGGAYNAEVSVFGNSNNTTENNTEIPENTENTETEN